MAPAPRRAISYPASVLRGLVLRALDRGPGFGTLVVRWLREDSRGAVVVHSYRVYQVLRGLARDGLVERFEASVGTGRTVTLFRLTAAGRAVNDAAGQPGQHAAA